MEQYNVEQNYLTGINPDNQIPVYLIQDSTKLLRVNQTATGLEWTNEAIATGYISETGDGSSNTSTNYVGYIFKNLLNTGLFNYVSGPFTILALRINNLNILECTAGQINANQNIFFTNDSLLSSQRINFGLGNCGISGDSTTGNQHKIVFRTDNQERLRISTSENILCKSRIQIDPALIYSLSAPHIYQTNIFTMGLSFDATNGMINLSSSGTNSMAQFKYDRIDLREPVIFRNPHCYPDLQIIENTSYTVPAGLTGNSIYYLKRGMVTHSDITFPNPASGFNPRYEMITDGNGNSSTFNCRISTFSNDILRIENGARTLVTGPVSNFVLVLNAYYIIQFCEADNKWIMIRSS